MGGTIEAGWYHAPNDPAGTERWWNGESWEGPPTVPAEREYKDTTGRWEPGWYHAPNDAEGTQRWWNGETWEGPPQVVYFAPHPDPILSNRVTTSREELAARAAIANQMPIPNRVQFPMMLTAMTIALALFKALPLFLVGRFADWLQEAEDADLRRAGVQQFQDVGFSVLVAVLLIATILLVIQVWAAVGENPRMLSIFAGIVAAFDLALALAAWYSEPTSAVLPVMIFLVQTTVAFWAASLVVAHRRALIRARPVQR